MIFYQKWLQSNTYSDSCLWQRSYSSFTLSFSAFLYLLVPIFLIAVPLYLPISLFPLSFSLMSPSFFLLTWLPGGFLSSSLSSFYFVQCVSIRLSCPAFCLSSHLFVIFPFFCLSLSPSLAVFLPFSNNCLLVYFPLLSVSNLLPFSSVFSILIASLAVYISFIVRIHHTFSFFFLTLSLSFSHYLSPLVVNLHWDGGEQMPPAVGLASPVQLPPYILTPKTRIWPTSFSNHRTKQ